MTTTTIEIQAPRQHVWDVLSDVRQMPSWTPSITAVDVQTSDGQLRPGVGVRIRQPRLRPAIWTVDEWDPPRVFSWTTTAPAVRTTARHELLDAPGGRTRVRLEVVHRGLLSRPVAALTGGMTRRYLEMEAQGLKRRCEARSDV